MNEFFANLAYFGVFLSIGSYLIGVYLNRRFKSALLNPLLISIVLCMAFLAVFKIDFSTFSHGKNNTGATMLQNLLTPTTACLAIPLYEKIGELKKQPLAILLGIGAGVLASVGTIFLMSKLFSLTREQYITLLPKSITTAIGMGVSEELGGYVSITVAVIIMTGILGNMGAELACRVFRITDPVARGVAIGTAAHAIGTTKAMELGEIEGAMSSLSIVVAGMLTVAGASLFAGLL